MTLNTTSDTIRVLHVDDEPDFVDMAATLIERENPRLTLATATSASEGRDRLASVDFDCIVSDYDMPRQNGIEFLETVREDYPDLPFILYTGKGSEEVASEAISAGVTDYLQKESGTSQYAVLAHRISNAVESYRSQKAVEATEQKLSQLAESSDEILFMFDSDWSELLFINSAYEEVWDRSIDELEANPQSFLENVHPEDQDLVEKTLERILDGKPTEVEHRILTDEEEVRWIYSEAKPIFDNDGTFTRIVGFVRDITERKEHEQELEQERAFVNQAIDALDDIFYVIGPDGELRRWNDRVQEVTGYTEKAIADMQVTDFFPEDEKERIHEVIEEVLTTGKATIEADLLTADGDHIPYEFIGSRLTDSEGNPNGLVGIGRDITERNQRNRRFEAIFNNTYTFVGLLDPDGTLIEANETALSFGELEREDVVGKPVWETYWFQSNEDARETAREAVEQAQNGELFRTEIQVQGSDREVVIDFSVRPVTNEEGEVILLVPEGRDITER